MLSQTVTLEYETQLIFNVDQKDMSAIQKAQKNLEQQFIQFGKIAATLSDWSSSETLTSIDYYALAYSIILMKELIIPSEEKGKNINAYALYSLFKKYAFQEQSKNYSFFTKPSLSVETIQNLMKYIKNVRNLLADYLFLLPIDQVKHIILNSITNLQLFANLQGKAFNLNALEIASSLFQYQHQDRYNSCPNKALSIMLGTMEEISMLSSITKDTSKDQKNVYALAMLNIIVGNCAIILNKQNSQMPLAVNRQLEILITTRNMLAHSKNEHHIKTICFSNQSNIESCLQLGWGKILPRVVHTKATLFSSIKIPGVKGLKKEEIIHITELPEDQILDNKKNTKTKKRPLESFDAKNIIASKTRSSFQRYNKEKNTSNSLDVETNVELFTKASTLVKYPVIEENSDSEDLSPQHNKGKDEQDEEEQYKSNKRSK